MNEIDNKFEQELTVQDMITELRSYNFFLSKEGRKLKNEKKLER